MQSSRTRIFQRSQEGAPTKKHAHIDNSFNCINIGWSGARIRLGGRRTRRHKGEDI